MSIIVGFFFLLFRHSHHRLKLQTNKASDVHVSVINGIIIIIIIITITISSS